MLRNVVAPERDFTQISNTQVWDGNLSDTAFRLLVRAVPLVACTACERVFRPVGEERRCTGRRRANPVAPAGADEAGGTNAGSTGMGWRERIGMVTPARGTPSGAGRPTGGSWA